MTRVLLLLALPLVTPSLAAQAPAAPPTVSERFSATLQRLWEEWMLLDPITATAIGDERYHDKLPDFTSAAYRAQNHAVNERYLSELTGFDRSKLVGQDRLSYDILKSDLEQSLSSERFPDWMQPINQFGGMPSFFAQLGSGQSIQPFRNTKDYDDWLKRADAAIVVFDGMIGNMRRGIAAGVVQPRPVLVIDTGLHTKGWTREQAIAYMLDNSSMVESDVVAEVERYIVIPGQALGYKIGQFQIRKLRTEAEQALGARFDIKAFHRQVLIDGALPMDVLATKIHEWIAAETKRP